MGRNLQLTKSRNCDRGFTLIEMLVVIGIFGVIIALAGSVFTNSLKFTSQQGVITQTQTEAIIGIEIMRTDIEEAGYGLPYESPSAVSGYSESTIAPASSYNDTSSTPPRAFVGGALITTVNASPLVKSDYLVIKSMPVASNSAATRWTYFTTDADKKDWGSNNVELTDRVVVIRPIVSESSYRVLVTDGSNNFSKLYSSVGTQQVRTGDVVYAVDPDTNLRVPFNRAEFYVDVPPTMPQTCAPNTGILYKAVMNHADGKFNQMPLLDCVAHMYIIWGFDMNQDGTIDTWSPADVSAVKTDVGASIANVQDTLADAKLLRINLKEVIVYIVAHEGKRDTAYNHASSVQIGSEYSLVRTIQFGSNVNYRWKVYKLVIRPKNL